MTDLAMKIAVAGIALSVAALAILGLKIEWWSGNGLGVDGGTAAALAGEPRGSVAAKAGTAAGASAQAEEEMLAEIPAERWLGAPDGGLSGASLLGKPVLVEFWTYLCYNCKNVEGWMKETYRTYAPEGLQVIGVHTPEFDVERNVENVRHYIEKNGIAYPVAIDNGMKVWRRYNATNAWPAFLVYDRQGKLVYRQAGERAVLGAEEAIRQALHEKSPQANSSVTGMTVTTSAGRESPTSAVLTVSFQPGPGYLLVKSPPNEVRLDPIQGVATTANPTLLGEPFHGADARDVSYFEGGASLRIPLRLEPALHGRRVELSGTVVYHVCDKATKVCARQQQAFSEVVAAS